MKERGPSRTAEAIVAFLVPPACREEILGDLHERFTSPRQYALDALRTIPLVIISRIRRTLDPQLLLIQAFALYMSFLTAAWLTNRALASEPWELLRLAISSPIAILALILDDAYANPGPRTVLSLARGPALGLIFALVALPRAIAFSGCAMGFLLSSALRICFLRIGTKGRLQ